MQANRAKDCQKLREVDIKAIILSMPEIRDLKPIVANEFVIGRKIRRADLVIMTDKIIAFEIKSDFDHVNRLEAQASEYAKYFDKVIVVVTQKHLEKVKSMNLRYVDIWEVAPDRDIRVVEQSIEGDHRSGDDLVKLLTKSEICRLSAGVTPDGLRDVCKAVKTLKLAFEMRYKSSSSRFWCAIGSSDLEIKHLEYLSKYAENRRRAAQQACKSEAYWAEWNENAKKFFECQTSKYKYD